MEKNPFKFYRNFWLHFQNNPFSICIAEFECIAAGVVFLCVCVCLRLPWGIIRNRPCDICSFGGPGEFGGGQIRKRPIRVVDVSLSAIVNLRNFILEKLFKSSILCEWKPKCLNVFFSLFFSLQYVNANQTYTSNKCFIIYLDRAHI